MVKRLQWILLLIAVMLLMGAVPPKQNWKEALHLYRAGNFKTALVKFQGLVDLGDAYQNQAGARFHLARCLDKLGRFEEAIVAYRAYLSVKDQPKIQKRVRNRLAELTTQKRATIAFACEDDGLLIRLSNGGQNKCPSVFKRVHVGKVVAAVYFKKRLLGTQTVNVSAGERRTVKIGRMARLTVQPNVSGAQIEIDGKPIQNSALIDWRLWPDRHQIVVSAAGHQTIERNVSLKPGEQLMWDVVLLPEVASSEMEVPGVNDTDSPEVRVMPWVLLASAVVAAGGTAALLVLAKNAGDTGGRHHEDYTKSMLLEPLLESKAKANDAYDERGTFIGLGIATGVISLALGGWAAASWSEDGTPEVGKAYPTYGWGFTW